MKLDIVDNFAKDYKYNMSFVKSIFDDDGENFNLWKKYNGEFDVEKEPILYSSIMLKKQSGPNQFSKRKFYMTQNYLYYKDSDDTPYIRGWTRLEWMRVTFGKDSWDKDKQLATSNQKDQCIYCVSLITNGKYCQLYTESYQIYLDWQKT